MTRGHADRASPKYSGQKTLTQGTFPTEDPWGQGGQVFLPQLSCKVFGTQRTISVQHHSVYGVALVLTCALGLHKLWVGNQDLTHFINGPRGPSNTWFRITQIILIHSKMTFKSIHSFLVARKSRLVLYLKCPHQHYHWKL